MNNTRFVFSNGVVSYPSDAPPVTTFLESLPGAYTTTRTHENGSTLLFWERIRWIVNNSMNRVLPIALKQRPDGEELAVTALVFDMRLHIGSYVPPVIGVGENGAHLALVGPGRDVAAAKYSAWVRLRKPLDKLRPPLVTELLLSNDGDRILEGCITNFFVVCRRDKNDAEGKYLHDYNNEYSVEVQTAPITDGVLPGIILQLVIEMMVLTFEEVLNSVVLLVNRISLAEWEEIDKNDAEGKYLHDYDKEYSVEVQTAPSTDGVLPGIICQLVIEVCLSKGIPVREDAPSWEKRELWEEAFITNSLRVLQHVEMIKVPHSWESLESKCFDGMSWMEKKFEGPGMITKIIQVKYDDQVILTVPSTKCTCVKLLHISGIKEIRS
ncbi:hypothetical protein PTKIN_Ptkin16aG0477600 [Pterospermum kingtungense]